MSWRWPNGRERHLIRISWAAHQTVRISDMPSFTFRGHRVNGSAAAALCIALSKRELRASSVRGMVEPLRSLTYSECVH